MRHIGAPKPEKAKVQAPAPAEQPKPEPKQPVRKTTRKPRTAKK